MLAIPKSGIWKPGRQTKYAKKKKKLALNQTCSPDIV